MGKWLDAFRYEACANSADSADSFANENKAGPFGTNGTIGTGAESGEASPSRPFGTIGTIGTEMKEGSEHPPPITSASSAVPIAHIRDEQDMLDDYEERAAIMQFCGNTPKAEAERLAWIDVFGSQNR